MSVDHKSTIDANKNDLLEVLRVGELLLTELCGEGVLDLRTKQEILAGGIQHEINGRFLDWLKQSQPSTFAVSLEKLRGDQQNHIANLLDGTPGERPLTKEKRLQIQKNIRNLSEVIDVDSGLLVLLYSMGVISATEQQELNSEIAKEVKAIKLLQVILQKSDRTLKCFVDALRETNQAHVISTLEKGDIIAFHAEFRSASDLLDKSEDELVSILESNAQQLSHLDNEEDPVEDILKEAVQLNEFPQSRPQLAEKEDSIPNSTELQDLPLEVLDWILMKALHFNEYDWVKTKKYVSNAVVQRFLVRLQTVSSVWEDRLNSNWFRIVFKRRRKSIEAALSDCPVLVRRDEWFARDQTIKASLNEPVSMVVITNTVDPAECYDEESCMQDVQYIQNFFIDPKVYNFLIGEDGRVYEGGGWKVQGAHTSNYNDISLGICFTGVFGTRAPCDAALRAAQELIRLGVKEGHIAKDYSLYGHRDLRPTSKTPGKYLYEIIKDWPNYKSMEL